MRNPWLDGIDGIICILLAASSGWQNGCCSCHHICVPSGTKEKIKERVRAHVRERELSRNPGDLYMCLPVQNCVTGPPSLESDSERRILETVSITDLTVSVFAR